MPETFETARHALPYPFLPASVHVSFCRLGGVGDILHGSHWRLGSGGLRIVLGNYERGCFACLRPWEWQIVGQDRRL